MLNVRREPLDSCCVRRTLAIGTAGSLLRRSLGAAEGSMQRQLGAVAAHSDLAAGLLVVQKLLRRPQD